jgi:hypothetical protein
MACGSSGWDEVAPGVSPAGGATGGGRTGGAPGVPTGGGGVGPSGGGGAPSDVMGAGGAPGGGGVPGGGPGEGGSPAIDADPSGDMVIDPVLDVAPDLSVDLGSGDASAPINLGSGLVGRWKLDEGAGATAADSSGSGNNGTINGATWVTTGFPGAQYANPAALRFDGKDAVMLGSLNLPANNRPQSVALWLNYSAAPGGNAQVFVALTDGNAGGSRLKVGFKEQKLAAFKSSGPMVSVTPPASGWHHLAYTYDGSMHRLFVDGVQRAMSGTAPDKGAVSNTRLGANFDQSEPFNGLLDDVRIYNRPLSPAEVAALHAGQE